jgi:D-inositol-3-phosphate glycosyltransferase
LGSQILLLFYVYRERPAIVHFQWLKVPAFDQFLVLYIQRFGAKVVYTAHNKLPHNSGVRYKSLFARIYAIVDSVIVHSERTREELIDEFALCPSKVCTIPHGLLEKGVHVTNPQENDKDAFQGLTIAFLGALSPYKGISEFSEAILLVAPKINKNQLKFIIAGKGELPCESDLLKLKNVHIDRRFLEKSQFQAYLAEADIIALPYRQISQSGVLLTAIAARKSLIVTDVGGLTEPHNLTGLGWVVKNSDSLSQELANLFEDIAKNCLTRQINGKQWEEINSFYSWDNIGKKTEELYQSLL